MKKINRIILLMQKETAILAFTKLTKHKQWNVPEFLLVTNPRRNWQTEKTKKDAEKATTKQQLNSHTKHIYTFFSAFPSTPSFHVLLPTSSSTVQLLPPSLFYPFFSCASCPSFVFFSYPTLVCSLSSNSKLCSLGRSILFVGAYWSTENPRK